jgi:hypothetical protein
MVPEGARGSPSPRLEREHVVSSSIASIGYDAERKTLEVEFVGGRVYRYYDVPKRVHSGLLEASSIGGYFNANIRPHFPYERL